MRMKSLPIDRLRVRWVPLCVALAFCATGGAATLAEPPTAAVAIDPYTGTAHLKTQETFVQTGGTTGLARAAFQGLLDTCNAFRTARYKFTAVEPPEAWLAGLDIKVVERYFDNGRAVEIRSGYGLTLPDLQRWLNELKAPGGVDPAVPPDCSDTLRHDNASGLLWRDGVRYELRIKKLALGSGKATPAGALDLPTDFTVKVLN